MCEFNVNDLLTLYLENNKTMIYINGKKFLQCMRLAINKKVDEIEDLLTLDSIDDITDNLEKDPHTIPPEVEFWGHCSNLQVWYENNYDTRMIHSSLAFPLLKKLADEGDLIAKRVFKEEIVKRLESGNDNTKKFLISKEYIKYLNREDLLFILLNYSDAEVIYELEKDFEITFNIRYKAKVPLPNSISIENKNVIGVDYGGIIISKNIEMYFSYLIRLKNLRTLMITNSDLTHIPHEIGELKNLEYLNLWNNQIREIPSSIGKLSKLKKLILRGNQIKRVPLIIVGLFELEELNLSRNKIKEIPDSIGTLKYLKELYLEGNPIKFIPDSIKNKKDMLIITKRAS